MRNVITGLLVVLGLALAASCRESGPGSWEIVSFEDLVGSNHFAGKSGGGREILAAVPDGEGGVCVIYHDRGLEFGRWSREGVETEHQVVDPDIVYVPDSVALVPDREGRPHVAFADFGRKKIKYAFWDGDKWTRVDVLTYGESYDYGDGMPYLSLALDSRSRPHLILFREATDPTGRRGGLQAELTYVRREGAGWAFEAVDSWPNKFGCSNSEGGWAEIAMAEGDVPHVCYCALAEWDGVFKYGVRTNKGWKTEVVAGGDHLEYASLEVGRQGKVHVSFACGSSLEGPSPGVYYAESEGAPWTLERVDGTADFSTRSSLALDGDGVPYIAYYELDRSDEERELYRLKLARRSGPEWSVVTVEEMDLFDLVTPDERIAITFGSRGRPSVAYLEQTGPTAYVKTARLVGGEWPAPSP